MDAAHIMVKADAIPVIFVDREGGISLNKENNIINMLGEGMALCLNLQIRILQRPRSLH